MEMEFDDLQLSIQESVRLLLERRAGPERVRELTESGAVDTYLLSGLHESGFLELFQDADAGPLCAALVCEWVSGAAGLVPIGWRALVAPSVLTGEIPLSVVVAEKVQSRVGGGRSPSRLKSRGRAKQSSTSCVSSSASASSSAGHSIAFRRCNTV